MAERQEGAQAGGEGARRATSRASAEVVGALVVAGLVFAAALFVHVLSTRPGGLLLPAPFASLAGGSSIRLLAPGWLGLLVLLPLPFVAAHRSLAGLPSSQRHASSALRAVLFALLALALAQPSVARDVTRTSTVFVVDVSDSVADAALSRAQALVDRAFSERGENDVELVTFASHASRVPAEGDVAPQVTRRGESSVNPGTRLDGALRLASSLFPAGHLRRLVVISDGLETEGSALHAAMSLSASGVRVHHVALDDPPAAEVAVTGIEVPSAPRVGQPFLLHVGLFATAPARIRLRVYRDDILEPTLGVPELALDAGPRDIEVRSVAHVAGPVRYRAEVEVLGPLEGEPGAPSRDRPSLDRYAENNVYETTLVVPGRPSVLYIEGTPSAASHLARALEASELEVDVRGPRATPTSAGELARYQMVILSDVAADDVSESSMAAITRWVRAGGAFMMAGGEHAFGLGGWQGTPIAEILPVRLDGERRRDDASIAIALVIDKSGSMEGEKMELAKEAARATVELLGPTDSIGVIGFDGAPDRVVRMQSAGNRLQILRDIGRLSAGGGTAIFPALDAAFQDLETVRARYRHVILLTDGNTDETGLPSLAAAMHASGITVSTVGIGADVNRALLAEIADVGGGRSHFTADAHNIPRIFVRETTEAMRNSVVEEYFLPRVASRADFLRGTGIEDAPWLRGYVATRARGAPAEVVLTTEGGEPLLARWRVGLGWSLAWTSDVKNRWAADWIRWPGYAPFFGQLVREHMRRRTESELPVEVAMDGDEAHLVVDALDDEDRFIDDLESIARVTRDGGGSADPDAERVSFDVPLPQTAPGRYEARTALPRFGSYAVVIEHRRGGEVVARSTGRIDHPYPREHALFAPRPEVLEELSSRTGGGPYAGPSDLAPREGENIEAELPVRGPLFGAAVVVFLLDVLLRRVRLAR